MIRLAMIVYALAGPTIAGSLMVVALASGFDTVGPVILSALTGFAAAVPVAWLIARELSAPRR